jgi:histidinol phosphatase-like PHP family hydrolase
MQWPEEVTDVLESGRGLTELRAVGKWTARIIHDWLEEPPEIPDPPEYRSGFMTMSEANRILVDHPDWRPALRGDLQMHTTWSDGHQSVRDMAGFAAARGHEYAAVTDHSKGLPIANGMDEATLLREGVEIDGVNQELAAEGSPFRLLRSIEMNLSIEGEGDMDPDVLGGLDLVLGAFHSRLRVTDDQTPRYLSAVRNPTVHVLAHPRGRRWNSRKGLYADWPVVFHAAAEAGTALEIDAYPDRQDLQVELLEIAREVPDLWISIGTDAHYPDELDFIEMGLAAAIRSGFPRKRILNFMSRGDLLAWATG